MTQVVTFAGYTPPARYDSTPWNRASVEEAPGVSGPWTEIDVLTLTPTDSDPSAPAQRNLTTSLATADALWYRLVFLDASDNTSQPTDAVQNIETASGLYVTRDELKAAIGLTGQSYADADIDVACSAASRAIDQASGQYFYADTSGTRYYGAHFGDQQLETDPITTLTSLTVDLAGDGSFSQAWTSGVDFDLAPFNNPAFGFPYERIHLRWMRMRYFPWSERNVKIVGDFGWTAVPIEIRQYATILASRLLMRTRQAPYGVITISTDVGAVAHISRTDPDFQQLVGPYVRARPFL